MDVVQNETEVPRRIRLRSAFDGRWLIAMAVGLVLSVAYYGLLFWAAVSALRWLLGL